MSLRAKSKYVTPTKPAPNAGLTLFCSVDGVDCHWVRLVLAEKDVEGARVEFQKPGRPSEDLLVLNPAQTLPTLADRDIVLYPARVIAEYLDERFPHPPMMPLEPSLRARLRMALDRIEHDLYGRLAVVEGGGPAARTARKTLAELLVTSARLFPARGWFLGLEYSIVDCAWIALFWRLAELRVELPAAADPIRRYSERAFARPAFRASLAAAR